MKQGTFIMQKYTKKIHFYAEIREYYENIVQCFYSAFWLRAETRLAIAAGVMTAAVGGAAASAALALDCTAGAAVAAAADAAAGVSLLAVLGAGASGAPPPSTCTSPELMRRVK